MSMVERARCPISRNPRKACGFTLLEVLLACFLAGILGVVVASLMRIGLAESRTAHRSRLPMASSWLLREQISADISNARAYSILPGAVVLGGFLSRDPETGMNTQHLAIVAYQIVNDSKRSVLQRIETLPGRDGAPVTFAQVAWNDVAQLIAEPKASVLVGELAMMPELTELGMQPMLEGLSLRLIDSQGRIILEIL